MQARDRFPISVDMRFNNQRSVNTVAGGVTTLIFTVIIMLYFGDLIMVNIIHSGAEIQ